MVQAAPRIILLGAGHAHLHVATHAGKLTASGAKVTLITRAGPCEGAKTAWIADFSSNIAS